MRRFPLLSFFGLAREMMYLQSYVRINDNTSAVVENIKRICSCTDVCTRVLTGSFEIEIWGQGLSLTSYSQDSAEIRGTIEQVRLVSRRLRDGDR